MTETRGRKALPEDKRKPPQTTVKINDAILPLVKELKGNLKNKTLTHNVIKSLFAVLHGKAEQQTSLYKSPDTVTIVEDLQGKIALLESQLRVESKKPSSGAIDLIEKINHLEAENARLTIRCNKEHIARISAEKAGIKLVQKYDSEHLKVIKLESISNGLASDKKAMKAEIEAMKHKEYDCQSLTGAGVRCTKPAKLKVKWHGVEINVCLQHSKKR